MRLVEGVDLASVVKAEGPMAPRRAVGDPRRRWPPRWTPRTPQAGAPRRQAVERAACAADDEDEFAYLIDFGIARATAGQTTDPR